MVETKFSRILHNVNKGVFLLRIGIISDTHDNLFNLLHVLEAFREKGIQTLIHCGDLTDHELISYFKGFRLIYIFGNMDNSTGAIQKQVMEIGEDNFSGMVFRGVLDGVHLAAAHSHIEGQVMALVREKQYKWIFHGHTHEKRDEVVRGTRIINPGALGGLCREPRTYCIIDLDTEEVEFNQIT
jgi:putative phosphoesterase